MSEIEIRDVKFQQPLGCKCGRALTRNNARTRGDSIDFICPACGASVIEIVCESLSTGDDPWD